MWCLCMISANIKDYNINSNNNYYYNNNNSSSLLERSSALGLPLVTRWPKHAPNLLRYHTVTENVLNGNHPLQIQFIKKDVFVRMCAFMCLGDALILKSFVLSCSVTQMMMLHVYRLLPVQQLELWCLGWKQYRWEESAVSATRHFPGFPCIGFFFILLWSAFQQQQHRGWATQNRLYGTGEW